jgi:hypothetical protein
MTVERKIEKDLEGSNRNLKEVFFRHVPGDAE